MKVTVNRGCWSMTDSPVSRQLPIKTEGKRFKSQGGEKSGAWPVQCTMREGGEGRNLGNLFLIFCLFWIPGTLRILASD